MTVSEETFRQVALEDPEGHWELYEGNMRRKPGATFEHNEVQSELPFLIMRQLDRQQFGVRCNAGYVRVPEHSYYIPDVFVIPMDLMRPLFGTKELEWYQAPMPLVVEIWSPAPEDDNIDMRLRGYQRRGDREIWRLDPYDKTLVASRREADGSYAEALYTGGLVHPVALPGVTVDLDALFTLAR